MINDPSTAKIADAYRKMVEDRNKPAPAPTATEPTPAPITEEK